MDFFKEDQASTFVGSARYPLVQCRSCLLEKECCAEHFSVKQITYFKSKSKSILCLQCAARETEHNNRVPTRIPVDVCSGKVVFLPIMDDSSFASEFRENEEDETTDGVRDSPRHAPIPLSRVYLSNPDVLPIDGFRYYPDFLSSEEAQRIMDIIDSNPWRNAVRRRQQFYGDIYYHTPHDVPEIQPKFDRVEAKFNTDEVLKSDSKESIPTTTTTHERDNGIIDLNINSFRFLMEKFYLNPFVSADDDFGGHDVFGRDISNFPTQILVNEYVGNWGIASHFEDEEAFGPVIATISLLSPIYMSLEQPVDHTNSCEELKENGHTRVLLEANSLFIMSNDCRFQWRHGITKHKNVHVPVEIFRKESITGGFPESTTFDTLKRNDKYRRVSLTIRHLLSTRKQAGGKE
jgi:hypothetical protein